MQYRWPAMLHADVLPTWLALNVTASTLLSSNPLLPTVGT
jgi:hypothetical protein